MDSLLRLQLKTHEHLSKVAARWKIKNIPDAHFEILASFRGYTLCIPLLTLRFSAEFAKRHIFKPGLYLSTLFIGTTPGQTSNFIKRCL